VNPKAADRLIVALDVADLARARELVSILSPQVKWFKVGSILFTREGPQVCEMVKEAGARLFLDLKFHDIPNTVRGAVSSALALGADMLTVHASGGEEMLRAAVEAREESGKDGVVLLAVTLLTHLDQQGFRSVHLGGEGTESFVLRMAGLALASGVSGVVASGREIGMLRRELGREPIIVVPGVRLEAAAGDDQKRSVTPEQALSGGADFLVVGRPILAAEDPARACQNFLDRMTIG